MSKWMLVLGLAAAFMFTSFAGAKEKKAGGPHGTVKAATATGLTLTSGHKGETKDTDYTFASAGVKVTLEDGTEGKLDKVVAGAHVALTLDADGKVTAITFSKPHAKKAA